MGDEKVVCIVGVAGFIGSHLLEKIIRERSWNVIGIDMVPPTKIQQLVSVAQTRRLNLRAAARRCYGPNSSASPPASLSQLDRSVRSGPHFDSRTPASLTARS